MTKLLGIFLLLGAIGITTAVLNPSFVTPLNLENTLRWTAFFGLLSVGATFVIITGGIDLSLGSLVALTGTLLCVSIQKLGFSPWAATALVLAASGVVGLLHGLAVTKSRLQPFVVTLCGLLIYRGLARWMTRDLTVGLGTAHDEGLRLAALGKPIALAPLLFGTGLALMALGWFYRRIASRRRLPPLMILGAVLAATFAIFTFVEFPAPPGLGGVGELAIEGRSRTLPLLATTLWSLSTLRAPTPLLILFGVTIILGVVLRGLPIGRHLLATGANERAAWNSGIAVHRVKILAYVICSLTGGLSGILLTLDLNSVQPAQLGNFVELYAIAAAVLGGASLRGGEGSLLGAIIATAVIRTLFNAINILKIPSQLDFPILGLIILFGVAADEALRSVNARRAALARRASGG